MKKLMIGLVAAAAMVGCCTQPCNGIKDSGTTYMADALAPYIEKGALPGAVSMLYKDGVTEVAERMGTDPAERAFYKAFCDFNPLNDLGSGWKPREADVYGRA